MYRKTRALKLLYHYKQKGRKCQGYYHVLGVRAWLLRRIRLFDLLTRHRQYSEVGNYSAIVGLHTLQFAVTHALGVPV
jgi:hypothetical protein